MAIDTRSKVGMAQIDGTNITFDVIVWAEPQTMSANQNYDEKMTKNRLGATVAIRAVDESMDTDVNFKLLADTNAHASLTANVLSTLGAPFLPPLQKVVLSGADLGSLAGTFQLAPGSKFDLSNEDVGNLSHKLRRWADAAQNTLLNTVPA